MALPLRKVVCIEDHVGPQGGEFWMLTLECGHVVARRKPRFEVWRDLWNLSKYFAPKRCRCFTCSKAKGPPKRASRSCGSRGPRD